MAEVTLQLPQIPKDCYYEDYVAAILNAGGYYLDRSVHRTEDGLDLLELDVVATKFKADHYEDTIVEVKSGGWGIKDLFKVNGWLHYLSYRKAAFIYQVALDNKDEATMQFDVFADKLFIQTQGAKGLSYRLDAGWVHLEPVANDKVVDTAGAGDWTAAALINELFKDKKIKQMADFSTQEIEIALNEAQKVGAKSCSYEGARGMMQAPLNS